MKILITARGTEWDSPLDPTFGRSAGFLLADTEANELTPIDNGQSMTAAQGAGIQAAETAVRAGAEALITGNVGPKAFRVLSAANVPVYTCQAETVRGALDLYLKGELSAVEAPTQAGHWQ
jgi:predicted Fe-Mo cluster-binding NifX family protein